MIHAVTLAATTPCPRLLILGAVHGNEKCGTAAIKRVLAEFESGALALEKGRVTFIPICNPRAYDADQRFIERNLNRYLVPMETPDCYEARLGNILCPHLASCDVLLDIHSYTVGGDPFILVGPFKSEERSYAESLGIATTLTGWTDAYAATGRGPKGVPSEESTGTTESARRSGAVAVTIECGQHKDPKAPEVAYRAIHNVLRHFGFIKERRAVSRSAPKRLITVVSVHYRDEGWNLPKDWKHLEVVTKGQAMALGPNGETLKAPDDGFIIMPKYAAVTGEEWFYFGVEKP